MQYDTKYIYELGKGNATRRFSFTTPPEVGPDVPYTFGVIGQYHLTLYNVLGFVFIWMLHLMKYTLQMYVRYLYV